MFGRTKSTPHGAQNPPETPSTPSGNTAMTPAPAPRQPIGYETVIGSNTTIKGDLRSKANVRIDGTVEGAVDIEGNVMVGETARITANVIARNEAKIAGAVRGNINARKVHLARTGRVWGDITAVSIIADEGAFIEGKITMTGHPAGTQGFTEALPAPGITMLRSELIVEGEHIEAEVVDDDFRTHEDKK
ncbi:MAG TPA: polymer-forming cytoskeletal protein [Aggregatilineales bacterium]|nr:polymer-forming cytoskeletal protein [Anaerolineales bacterium]HRE47819.1 polymer-forming cytoskeletal protein [Aggregatilineales bacterium]